MISFFLRYSTTTGKVAFPKDKEFTFRLKTTTQLSVSPFLDSQVWNMDRKSQPMHTGSPYDLQPVTKISRIGEYGRRASANNRGLIAFTLAGH